MEKTLRLVIAKMFLKRCGISKNKENMMNKKIQIVMLLVFFSSISIAHAIRIDDVDRFQENNPDGKKYEFVSSFVKSLEYLKSNDERNADLISYEYEDLELKERGGFLIKNLDLDNVNLRIARNMMKKNYDVNNGLMLKVSDIFVGVCNKLIEINAVEKSMLQEVQKAFRKNKLAQFDQERFILDLEQLRAQRKEASSKIIEASFIISKLLISPQTDDYGELIMLGVTDEQRSRLLDKMDVFYGDMYDGELREGQTSLEGSIVVIREILENYRWDSLDG